MSPVAQETISHYRLLALLGRGGMGEVWLAEDTQLPRKVAVKLLPRHLAEDRDAVDRLLSEARAAASVDHPAVVTVYEAGLAEGQPYIVMQRAEGETLEVRLRRGPLPVAEAIALAMRVADALAEVHALGIVHRDLKSSNIILTPRGPKLLDFGVASVQGSPRLTSAGAPVGTPLAMSPEQLEGLTPDKRSDLWSLGVILYQALTGRTPFAAESLAALFYQVLNETPAPPSLLRPEVPAALDTIVMRLLEKDPTRRPARAEDLLGALAGVREEPVAIDAAHPGPTSPAAPPHPAGAGRVAATRAPAGRMVPIAVLYFEVLSTEPKDAFLAAGLAEDLIVDLTRVAGLRVASRAEVLARRDRAVPARTLGRELGVDYLLSGSVRRAGERARIAAQLVRVADGHTVWAERYDRTLDDLFEVQAEVSKRIVEALEITLAPGEREMLERVPTRSAEAYHLFLEARDLIDQETRDANHRAEELLLRALELDPDFAVAHAILGEMHALRGMLGWEGPETADRAMACAERAAALEPNLLEAHWVRAMAHRLKGQPRELLLALERVIALDPDHPQALEWAARCYMVLDKPVEAAVILRGLTERHPERFLPPHYASICFELLGRTEEAAQMFDLALERETEYVRRHPADPKARVLFGTSLIRAGQREAGVRQVERALDLAPEDGRMRYNAGCAFARAGLPERAIEQLREAQPRLPRYMDDWPRRDPDLATLWGHPEFIRMFGKSEAS